MRLAPSTITTHSPSRTVIAIHRPIAIAIVLLTLLLGQNYLGSVIETLIQASLQHMPISPSAIFRIITALGVMIFILLTLWFDHRSETWIDTETQLIYRGKRPVARFHEVEAVLLVYNGNSRRWAQYRYQLLLNGSVAYLPLSSPGPAQQQMEAAVAIGHLLNRPIHVISGLETRALARILRTSSLDDETEVPT